MSISLVLSVLPSLLLLLLLQLLLYISHRDIYFYLIYFCAVALQISTQSFSHFLCASSAAAAAFVGFRFCVRFVYLCTYIFILQHPSPLLFLSLFLPFLRFDTRFQLICRFDDKISVFSSGYVNVRGMQEAAGEQEVGSVLGQGLKRCTNIGYSDWRG